MGVYSTAESINAGLDIEMPGLPKWGGQKLLQAVKDEKVTEDTIDTSARGVLKFARRLGSFAHPHKPRSPSTTPVATVSCKTVQPRVWSC